MGYRSGPPGLGALVRVGRSSKFVGTLLAVVGGVLAVGMLVPTIIAIASMPLLLVVVLPFDLLGSYLLYTGLKYRAQSLAIHDGGVVRTDFRSRVEATWSELTAVRRESFSMDGEILCDTCWIDMPGRPSFVAVDIALSDFGTLGRELDTRSAAALTPRYELALRNGESVSFGPIGMTSQALSVDGASYPWSEVESISFDRSQRRLLSTRGRYEARPTVVLTLRKPSGERIDVTHNEAEIANPGVFADLASRIGGVNVSP